MGPAARGRDPGLGRRTGVRGPRRHTPPGSPRRRQAFSCRAPRRSVDGRRRAAPRRGRAPRHEPLLQVRSGDPAPDSRGRGARRAVAGHERRSPVPDGAGRTRVSAVLEVRGARYVLPEGRVLVADVSFGVAAGETLVLLGRSGSGKTTTLKLINRLLEPTAGEIRVAGQLTHALEATRLRRGIGYVIQEIGLFPHFTVERNVGLVPRLEGWPAERIAARVRELLTLVGLDPGVFGARYPHELSGGQRQRVGVARALAADPALLLMDEPFGSLDPLTRDELQREFLLLQQRLHKTVVFVTHDVGEALRLGSRVALMETGRLVTVLAPQEFLRSGDPWVAAYVKAFKAGLDSAANRGTE